MGSRHIAFIATVCLAVVGVIGASPAEVDADTPLIEILSPVDGASDVATPIVVTGRVSPDVDWRDVWVRISGENFFAHQQATLHADGTFEYEYDPRQTGWWTGPVTMITARGSSDELTESPWDRVFVDLDMSRRDTSPPVFSWNLDDLDGHAISFPFDLEMAVEPQFHDSISYTLDVYDESDQRIHRSLSHISGQSDPNSPWRLPPFEKTVTLDLFRRLEQFDGPTVRFEIAVTNSANISVQHTAVVMTDEPDYSPGEVTVESPRTSRTPLEYPIRIAGTATGGYGGLDAVTVRILEFAGPFNNNNDTWILDDQFEHFEVPVEKDGTWTMWFDPRWVEGWTWGANQQFSIQVSAKDDASANYHAEPYVTVRGEEVSKYCFGYGATVDLEKGDRPTPYSDIIVGTPSRDRIEALGGHDIICALEGRDVIIGGDGHDLIDGGPGRDRIITAYGNDTVYGRGGSDRIRTGIGDDGVVGGSGDDKIKLGPGDDIAYGDAGNDEIAGDGGEDWIFGGDGNDVINAGRGPDHVSGGPGNDRGTTGSGSDECIDGNFTSCELNHDNGPQ